MGGGRGREREREGEKGRERERKGERGRGRERERERERETTFSLSVLFSLDSASCNLCSSFSIASVNTTSPPFTLSLDSERSSPSTESLFSAFSQSPELPISSHALPEGSLFSEEQLEEVEGSEVALPLGKADGPNSMGVSSLVEVLAPSGSDGEGFLDPVLVSPSQTSI